MSESTSRQYWIFDKGYITLRIAYLQSSLKTGRSYLGRSERSRIKAELHELEEKRFLDISSFVLQERSHGIFGEPQITIPLFGYSQNNEFIEFFTGIKIGNIVKDYYVDCVKGPYYDCIFLERPAYKDFDDDVARSVDAASFASEVRPFLGRREDIASVIRTQLNRIIEHKQVELEKERSIQDAVRAQNAAAEDFLNRFI